MTITQFIQLPILGHKDLCFSTRNFVISKTTAMWPFFAFLLAHPDKLLRSLHGEVELLCRRVSAPLISPHSYKSFCRVFTFIDTKAFALPSAMGEFLFSHVCSSTWYCQFLNFANLNVFSLRFNFFVSEYY